MSKSEKQRVSDLIQQRIREKKEREIANRPRAPVLKVMFANAATANAGLLERKKLLEMELQQEASMLATKTNAVNAIAESMREPHTQVTVKTDFYASEAIPTAIKEFYRKSSNNFLKMAILQKRALNAFKDKQNMVAECLRRIRSFEETIRNSARAHRKAKEDQLVANANQRLRYEDAVQRGRDLAQATADLHQRYAEVGKEYDFKKNDLDRMEEKVSSLRSSIQSQIKQYEATYNVVAYRGHLHKVFSEKFKIECLEGQVKDSYADAASAQDRITQLEDSLQKMKSFVKIGKVESLRTASKSRGHLRTVASSRDGLTDRNASLGRFSTSNMNTTGFLTDRAIDTDRKTKRSIFD